MKPQHALIAAIVLVLVSIAHSFPGQDYESELHLGIEAYKSAHYDEAILHFRNATELDPSKPVAHLYLATAYVSQYIPGVETEENLHFATQAIDQYQKVLNSDANTESKVNSNKGIAYLYLNMKKTEDARWYYQKGSGLDPNDPEAYYSVGTIDWMQCYQPRMEARARLGLEPDEHLNAAIPKQQKVCQDLKGKNSAAIQDGMDNLNRAIELRPDYDDAMAYMNLMYRERADLECDDSAARDRDLKTADLWVDKTLAVKKAKAEHAAGAISAPPPPPEKQ